MYRRNKLLYNQQQPQPYFHPHGPQHGPRGFQRYQQQREDPGYWQRPPILTENRNEEQWCETCDRGFPNLNMLENHNKQHQKCNIDGCQFIAHPKVITKHIQMQHSSGLFKKIGNLKNPEEIKKWLEERKNKYPTKQNVEKKAAETKEKIERGEKIGLVYDRSKRNTEPVAGTKRKQPFTSDNQYKNRKLKQNSGINITDKKPKRNHNVIPLPEENRKLKPFTGIRDLIVDHDMDDKIEQGQLCDDLIEDDDDIQQSFITTKEPSICGALSTLICNYGSSDEETDIPIDPQKDVPSTENDNIKSFEKNNSHHQIIPKQQSEDGNKISDDESGPEEVKVIKETTFETDRPREQSVQSKFLSDKKVIRNERNIQHRRNNFNSRVKRKVPSTLLQKLLHREIRQERNIVLQCVRYIVKHNYFDSNAK